MIFKDRMKLVDQYKEWLKGYPEISDCPASVIAFLDINGFLKDERERNRWIPCSERLPSAQPEIIRCKDCKHWDGVDTCDVIDAPVWDNDFCSMAERRSNE